MLKLSSGGKKLNPVIKCDYNLLQYAINEKLGEKVTDVIEHSVEIGENELIFSNGKSGRVASAQDLINLISEAVAKVKSGEIKKTFHTDISSGLEDFIVARDLNNELKLVPSSTFVLLFGNLDHLVTKEPIQYPADFIRFDGGTEDREVDFINQVYGLVPDKNEDPERLISLRQSLRNMLRTASAVTVRELLYG